MQKISLTERPDWKAQADHLGFTFASMHGEPYWDESSAYAFTLAEIEENIEDPSTELHSMCRQAVDEIVQSQELMEKLAIPEPYRDLVADSWRNGHPELYGRFDLAYDGSGPAKMLEYNADTPTSLYESASFQWKWLEDQIANGILQEGDDQFNGIHEAMVERFQEIFAPNSDIHFTSVADNAEDYGTVEAMAWAARDAGLGAHYTTLDKIGVTEEGQFTDDEDKIIGVLFKLYPWEDLLQDDYAQYIAGSGALFLEPAWKALLSNKGILPVLWQMFEGHPNLLPAYFEDDVAAAMAASGSVNPAVAQSFARAEAQLHAGHVTKPIFSREGASVAILQNNRPLEVSRDLAYSQHPKIVQAYQPLTTFDGFHPILGSWIVGQSCVGLGIREDRSRITANLSRFKPHFIRD